MSARSASYSIWNSNANVLHHAFVLVIEDVAMQYRPDYGRLTAIKEAT